MNDSMIGAWFAWFLGSLAWKVSAFLLTWLLAGLVVGWVTGSMARVGGDDEDEGNEQPDWTAIEHGERRDN